MRFKKANRPLERDFYLRDAVSVGRELLGKRLVHRSAAGETDGIIVETEAYTGRDDAACHSYRREKATGKHRTDIMFGPGGFAYVYLIYGMYDCFNVVVNETDRPEAVLIRAIRPLVGIELMGRRRGISDAPKKLCSGPGKLCIAMGITREHYGQDLCGSELFLTEGEKIASSAVSATPRINVDYAGEAASYPYRFVIRDSPYLSTKKFLEE